MKKRSPIPFSLPFSVLLIISMSIIIATDASDSSNDDCRLRCMSNGACRKGEADFSGHPLNAEDEPFHFHANLDRDGEYCECPLGYTGLLCNVPYKTCPKDVKRSCYNGGECIGATLYVGRELKTEYFCDCRKARTVDGDFAVGASCEVDQGHDTVTTCNKEGNAFCANNGRCNDRSSDKDIKPCICTDGYQGTYCELHEESVKKMPVCTTQCQNGGVCQHSLRNPTIHELEAFGVDFEPNNVTSLQHCQCKDGWMGKHCEVQLTPCGDNLNCMFGAHCTKFDDQPVCDCTTTTPTDHLYGGRQCEHAASSFCQKSLGVNGYEYCTNGGECLQNTAGVFGCKCPAGYTGPHCEFTPAQTQHSPDPNQCLLQCRNGGECRTGIKDHGVLKAFQDLEDITGTRAIDLQYCTCTQEWGGLLCDTKVEICGANEHVCLHGSTCEENKDIDNNNNDHDNSYTCNCEAASSKVAGIHCQHKATSTCAEGHFCTNGGLCGPANTCKCLSGFGGERCEIALEYAQVENYDDDIAIYTILGAQQRQRNGESDRYRIGIILGSILTALGIIALSIGLVYRYDRHRTSKELDTASSMYPTPPKEAFGRKDLASLESGSVGSNISTNNSNSANISPFGDGEVPQDEGVMESIGLEYDEAGREQQLKSKHEIHVI